MADEDQLGRLVRTCKDKVTIDSPDRLGVAANWLDGDFVAAAPNQKWAGGYNLCLKACSNSPSSSIDIAAALRAGQLAKE